MGHLVGNISVERPHDAVDVLAGPTRWENLVFSVVAEDDKLSIWEFSMESNTLKQVSNPFQYALVNMTYSKNGLNILYEQYNTGIGGFIIKMKPIAGKSLSILDSVSGNWKKFILSPDNRWILYDKMGYKKTLYRWPINNVRNYQHLKRLEIMFHGQIKGKRFFSTAHHWRKNM